jgi:phosphate-selective porin
MFLRATGFKRWAAIALALLVFAYGTEAEENTPISRSEFEELKRQLASIQKENLELRFQAAPFNSTPADQVLNTKYGPNGAMATKAGKLTISGLLQVWYYYIQNDRHGLFDDPVVNNITDFNSASSNDSFRIRRAELRFTFNLSEHISGVIMLDPAREATSFPSFPDNQGLFKRAPNSLTGSVVSGVQTGVGAAPRFLQDAYILYKDVVPHHDLQVGQYKPPFGDEALRPAGELDFAERSFLGQLGDFRDLGAHVRGHWWSDRFQYWIGAFDAAGNYFGSGGQQQNRTDDNDDKDLVLRGIVRPLWRDECWGSLELGGSASSGYHGQAGSINPVTAPIGLNRPRTWATRLSGFGSYFAPGDFKGLWLRGEWARIHDRNVTGTVVDLLKQDLNANGLQDDVRPFSSQAWNVSAGYRLGERPSAKCVLPEWARKLEVAFRYESIQNVQIANVVTPYRTDDFSTRVYTAGVNYYILGNSARLQVNYNHLHNPDTARVGSLPVFHQVKNDNLIVNFQLAF